ncbi:MAG: type IV pilus twitching motility protein PilT [Candidatus Gastranaerophilales bacterium]|nr:type IV pilus twitching motility protein PilT [Candidatus Gastranaerophilales bacterium]
MFESDINNNEIVNVQRFDLQAFLKISVSQGISDIHIRINTPPMVRRDGLIIKTKLPPITIEDMELIIKNIVPQNLQAKIDTSYDIDFSIEIPEVSRFRVNLLHDLGNLGFVMRVIPFEIPPIEKLYLPPSLLEFTKFNNGLILITGPTGSGKSTTLASLLDYINQNQQKHIITIEDPIEFMHTNKKCVFTQRQLGTDTDSFPNGMKYALRQDPDIILIGEMRDRETIINALKAAETGHLVFSTLHTNDAVQTINRIINSFEPYERESIRAQIAETLKGTVSQKLVRKAEGKGRVPATEILTVTPAARDYILRDEINQIYDLIKTGSHSSMMSMNLSLHRLFKAGLITKEAALQASDTPAEIQQMLSGAFHGTDTYNK